MKNILVCGVGAIGSNLVANLIGDSRGDYKVTILDYDKVEERNVSAGTQYYFPEEIGMYKVDALELNIYKAYEKELNLIHEKLSGERYSLLKGYDLIIDCFDNFEARLLTQTIMWKQDVLHIGFSEQMTFSIEWAENYQVPKDAVSEKDICELQGAGSFVKLVAALGSLVVQEFLFNEKKKEFVGNGFNIREIN